ncbi:hypothetical protein HJA87_06205 [Rhizobium bangladeshense]|uniref:Uncharacterized protein n=1 Tax=Rhizobium bangladeshense TaxID=1138189 RepID=A0ABS7LDC2_9HYPH|nr:hypothetical protein [Rhizobium bangladeshense]MBY3589476.1 hypothetical protein [Rhizobium bangladeshense]
MDIMDIELEADTGVLLGHLTGEQRQYVQRLDTAFADLLAQARMDPAQVEVLADAVTLLYDEVAAVRLDRETGLESPVCKNGDAREGRTARSWASVV